MSQAYFNIWEIQSSLHTLLQCTLLKLIYLSRVPHHMAIHIGKAWPTAMKTIAAGSASRSVLMTSLMTSSVHPDKREYPAIATLLGQTGPYPFAGNRVWAHRWARF